MTTLEPLSAEHFETVARWLATPAINCWLSGDWRDKEISATVVGIAVRNRKNRFFLVNFGSKPCGLVALSEIEVTDNTAMAWYLIGEQQFTGKGIASSAVKQLVRVAFSELGLQSVYAWAMEPNAASIRLLTKLGFRPAGRIRHSASLNGQQVDRLYFDITPADFAECEKSLVRG